jgi:hypothetical protein
MSLIYICPYFLKQYLFKQLKKDLYYEGYNELAKEEREAKDFSIFPQILSLVKERK